MKDTDQIAQIGEDKFSHICHKENLIVNSSKNQDQGGWDFIVENKVLSKGEDKVFHESLNASLFQLKTTKSPKQKSWRIALSNLLRFAKQTVPCFYCLIILDEENEINEVYIRILDDELITKIKENVSMLVKNKALDRLNVEKMTITLRKQDKVNFDLDKPVQKTIEKLIDEDYLEYVRKKMDFYKSIGMDKNIVINFSSSNEVKDFVYFLLGYKNEVKLHNASMIESCFGSVVKNLELNGSTLSSNQPEPNLKGSMQLHLNGSPENLKFNVNYYVLPYSELFGKDFNLCRIESTYLDIFYNLIKIGNNKADLKYNFKTTNSLVLSEFLKTLKLLKAIKEHKKASLNFQIDKDKTLKFDLSNIDADYEISAEYLTFIERFKILSDKLDLSSQIPITKSDLDSIDNIKFSIAYSVAFGEPFRIKLDRKSDLKNNYIVEIELKISNYNIFLVCNCHIGSEDDQLLFTNVQFTKVFVVGDNERELEEKNKFITELANELKMEAIKI